MTGVQTCALPISGYPHLEEAYWFGEGVLPILERRGLWRHPAPPREAPQTVVPFTPMHPAATQGTTDRIAAS